MASFLEGRCGGAVTVPACNGEALGTQADLAEGTSLGHRRVQRAMTWPGS